jgi:hypothetical protein
MRCFIQIRDGNPFEHPIIETNFRQAFPHIDVNNLPEEFAEFIRHPQPEIDPYEIYQGVNYKWIDGKVQDVHIVREMIESERQDKINFVKSQWEVGGFKSWIFNEELCTFEPPFPAPDNNHIYVWDETIVNWKAI